MDDLELQVRALLSTGPTEKVAQARTGFYSALLNDLGLEDGAVAGPVEEGASSTLVVAPVSGDASAVRVRVGDHEVLLNRGGHRRERVAVFDGRPMGEGLWDCGLLWLGDLPVEVRAAPGEGAEVVYILPDRVLVGDAPRFVDQASRLGLPAMRALGLHAQSLITGSAGLRGGLPATGLPGNWPKASPDDNAAADGVCEARWRELGSPHPDGYRQISPLEAWVWLDRFLLIEAPAREAGRHIPGAIAAEISDPSVLSRALAPVAQTQAILLVSEFGYDCRPFARRLVQDGFARVFHLKGGTHRWRQNELPTTPSVRLLASLGAPGVDPTS